MKLLLGGAAMKKKRTATSLTPPSPLRLLTVTLLIGLLDRHGCLALNCYSCDDSATNCKNGELPTSTGTTECKQGQVCGRSKVWYGGEIVHAEGRCFSINPTECQKGILGDMSGCFTKSWKQWDLLREKCKTKGEGVETEEGAGRELHHTGDANNMTSSRESSEEKVYGYEYCICSTDLCNAGDCKCMPANGVPPVEYDGSGGGSKGASGTSNSIHRSNGLGGRMTITGTIAMITMVFVFSMAGSTN